MVVKVIAMTRFLGVPEELGDDVGLIALKEQDRGSDCARLVECAGRACYRSYGKGRASKDFHQNILESKHGNVAEHASISFYIAGISRNCSHEWVRHRAGCAVSQESSRYVDSEQSPWCWHPLAQEAVAADPRLRASLADLEATARARYEALVTTIQDRLLATGVDKLTARKQARGAARGALGTCLSTSMVWTANIRALRNVLEQRCSRHADIEIRLLSNEVFLAARAVCPEYFSDYQQVPCQDEFGFELTTNYPKV